MTGTRSTVVLIGSRPMSIRKGPFQGLEEQGHSGREVVLNDVSRPRMGHAQDRKMETGLTGAWLLQSAYMEDVETGERFELEMRAGVLMIRERRLMVLITSRGPIDPQSEDERAQAFDATSVYSGRFRLQPQNQMIITIDACARQSWLGREMIREYEFFEDTLILRTAAERLPRADNMLMGCSLVWMREHGDPRAGGFCIGEDEECAAFSKTQGHFESRPRRPMRRSILLCGSIGWRAAKWMAGMSGKPYFALAME